DGNPSKHRKSLLESFQKQDKPLTDKLRTRTQLSDLHCRRLYSSRDRLKLDEFFPVNMVSCIFDHILTSR
uniref:Uncharacterized protein n=1 Tax=Cynoglossus semilaevis TaxID=244447 RepID=A0A3P8VHR1_CYNSE